jgi:glycosyltransferase involved in cell wall biosynthesis
MHESTNASTMIPLACDGGRLPNVTVVTHSPSPYQVELFDQVEAFHRLKLKVIYLYARDGQRLWQSPSPFHHSVMLTSPGVSAKQVLAETDDADLLVLNYYKHPFAKAVVQRRAHTGSAICFWGERPQPRAFVRLSSLLRRWRLRGLMRNRAHFWGIGRMAVDAYRREFGGQRTYANLPYFSELTRFSDTPRRSRDGTCVFLFSGVLSHRKGVDVLANAFARLAPDFPYARLRVMGSGNMESVMRERLRDCMDRVEFIGFREWTELHLEYAQADLLCVPSRHDGWGLVVPEGLAAGLPVISTHQTGAAVEFVQPSWNGWLIPKDHDEALYRAMRQAASLTDEQWHEMSQLARASVADHTLEHGGRRFIDAACAALTDWRQPRDRARENAAASSH